MKYTKQFIESAIKGGWKPFEDFITHNFRQDDGNKDWFQFATTSTWGDDEYEEDRMKTIQQILLDPKSWEAVSKVEGWKTWKGSGLMPYIHDWVWHRNMHRMIDALAGGKSIESFLETLFKK